MTGIELLRKFAETRPPTVVTCSQLPDALGKKCDDFKNCNDCHRFVCKAIADQIEREIEEVVADEVVDTLSAYEMNTNARWYSAVEDGPGNDCRDEYELISRYWLPRPRFEDGKVVQMGDEYVSEGGNVYKCDGYRIYQDGEFELLTETSPHCWYTPRFELGGKVKRPVAKVLDADGVEIKVGDEVWVIDNGRHCKVFEVCETSVGVNFIDGHRGPIVSEIQAFNITHKRPEPPDSWERIEADAKKGPCVYYGRAPFDCTDEDGGECRVLNTDDCNECMALEIVRRCKKLAGVD